MNLELIRKVLKRKSVNNGLWLYGLQFFNTVIPLLTLPYITRVLGSSRYGVFTIALNFTMYLQVAIEYGFALSATRQMSSIKSDEELNKLFSSVVFSRLIIYFICILFSLIYMLISDGTSEYNLCFVVLSFSLVGYCFQQNWLFQGKQEMKYISISSIIARSLSAICILIFVKKSEDIVLYCILYSLSPIVTNFIGTVIALFRYKIKWVPLSAKDICTTLHDGVYIFFTNLSSKVFGAIGVTFLGIFASESDVGIYSALYKIPYILMLLWQPITQVIYPITSQRIRMSFSDGYVFIGRLRRCCLFIFGLIALLVGIAAKPIARIAFGEEYSAKFYIIYPLLIWMILGIYNNFLGIQTLVGSGHDKQYSHAFLIGVAVTIGVNFILIYFWGIHGASLAPMISEASLSILLLLQVKKVIMENKGLT